MGYTDPAKARNRDKVLAHKRDWRRRKALADESARKGSRSKGRLFEAVLLARELEGAAV